MDESVFERDGERFIPTAHARGPWSPEALHGGAPAALFTQAFERIEPGSELRMARIGVEYLRPLTFAPMELSTRIVRPGRRVQELAGELHAGGELICRASALRVSPVPEGLPAPPPAAAPNLQPGADTGAATEAPQPATHTGAAAEASESPTGALGLAPWPARELPPPEAAQPAKFGLNRSDETSFAATVMEMRWFGDPYTLGPGCVWMRMRMPLIAGEPLTPLTRLAAVADFGNGASAALPFDGFLFINADLTIHLTRPPRGEWIGLDARTELTAGGSGLSESVLHDEHGPVGRAFQTLVVQRR
jgi:hypothetical protein